LSRRASEAARKRSEASRQAIKVFSDLAARLADERRREAERAPQDSARAWRWVAHHRPDLEAIARRHVLDFGELIAAAHRRVRRKRVDLPAEVIAEFDQLNKHHSLYDAWSAEPPSETYPTTVTVAIDPDPDEEAVFTHYARTKEPWLTRRKLDARFDQVGEATHVTVSAELRLGDIISANVGRSMDRRENARRLADWERRGSDPNRLPDLLPSRTTWFLRLTPTDVLEVPPDRPGRPALVSYLVGSSSLAEALAGLGLEEAIPDWLTLPGVFQWWRLPNLDLDVKADDNPERLEAFLRAWATLGRIVTDINERDAREYARIELALTSAEAMEVRRLAVDEAQSHAAIGSAFRAVWDEFVAEPGARASTNEDVGKRLCTVIAAHFGEDPAAPPLKRSEAPAATMQRRDTRSPVKD
jgi:hypothetical protein